MAQWVKNLTVSMRIRVRSLASLSGLKIWYCHCCGLGHYCCMGLELPRALGTDKGREGRKEGRKEGKGREVNDMSGGSTLGRPPGVLLSDSSNPSRSGLFSFFLFWPP